jgi:hypothetical protein
VLQEVSQAYPNLSFYRSLSEWLSDPRMTMLPFADYEAQLREVLVWFGGNGASVEIPQLNAATGQIPKPSVDEVQIIESYCHADLPV